MIYALPAAAVVLLSLWMFFTRRRLAVLRENADQALASYHAQQLYRTDALAALVDLTQEYAPGAVWVRSDVVQACCGMISKDSSLKDVGKRERTMSRILSQIAQAVQLHPEMRNDERYLKCVKEMEGYEALSRANRLLYNDSVTNLNRQLLRFPTSMFGRMLGFQKLEYIVDPENDVPLNEILPGDSPYSACSGGRAPPDSKSGQRSPDGK